MFSVNMHKVIEKEFTGKGEGGSSLGFIQLCEICRVLSL
jgi:hypothetical protein